MRQKYEKIEFVAIIICLILIVGSREYTNADIALIITLSIFTGILLERLKMAKWYGENRTKFNESLMNFRWKKSQVKSQSESQG